MTDYWASVTSSTTAGWHNENDSFTQIYTEGMLDHAIRRLEDRGISVSKAFKERFRTPVKNWKKKIEGLK